MNHKVAQRKSGGVSRRSFLQTSAVASGGLLIGVGLPASMSEALAAGTIHTPTAWVHIADDNTITLISARSEMGQGVYTSMPMLIAGRVVQGLGAGLTIVAVYVVIGQCYPESLRPKVMSLIATAWVVPSVVGPFVAGSLTQYVSWRWAFLSLVPLVPLPLAFVIPRISRDRPREAVAQTGRIPMALAMAVGAGVLQWAGLEAGDRSWTVAIFAAVVGLGRPDHRTVCRNDRPVIFRVLIDRQYFRICEQLRRPLIARGQISAHHEW